jgi:hypothetical protein
MSAVGIWKLFILLLYVTVLIWSSPFRFFLTIGFGDFYPNSEAGRPIFIVYALLAVPTMTIIGSWFAINLTDIVETVTTNFTAFTMQRVHKRKSRVYQEKDFEIQSMTSLVKMAKEKTCERINSGKSDNKPVQLPLHDAMERLTDGLQQMHHHLQSLLMQKLGPEARNVIAAERARQSRADRKRLDQAEKRIEKRNDQHDTDAKTLADLGQNPGDELELLNEYREQYAAVLAELLVAKDRLIDLEKRLEKRACGPLRRRLSDEISELSDDESRRARWVE